MCETLAGIEAKWRAIGGVPHYAKLYGVERDEASGAYVQVSRASFVQPSFNPHLHLVLLDDAELSVAFHIQLSFNPHPIPRGERQCSCR